MMNLPGGTKDRYYRAATGQSRKSITVEFVCLPRNAMSVESMNYTSEVIGAIKREVMSEGMIDGKVRMTEAELNRRMEAIAEKLNERDDVKYVRIHSRGEVLRVKFTTLGAETGFSIHRTILPEDDKESAPPDNDAPSSSTENNSVNSKKIVSLHPYEAQKGVGGHDLLYSVSPLITKYPHLLKEYRQIVNSDIRMEHYRNAIRDARLVFISTHGGTITVFSGVDATLHMSKLDGELSMERTSPFPASRFSAATTIPAYLGASIWAAWW